MSLANAPNYFYLFQAAGLIVLIGLWFIFKPKHPESGFQVRESERLQTRKGSKTPLTAPDMASATLKKSEPLRISGIRIDGTAHEILGIPWNASKEQIQKAYRDLMKQYHPDRIGRPDSREWNEAQKIAEAINRAKEELLSRFK